VNNVQLVLVKMTKDKHRALNAAPVNSAMRPVLSNVNRALPTRITVKREEIQRASIAQ